VQEITVQSIGRDLEHHLVSIRVHANADELRERKGRCCNQTSERANHRQ
jgi:hypothetical protein